MHLNGSLKPMGEKVSGGAGEDTATPPGEVATPPGEDAATPPPPGEDTCTRGG